MLNSYDAFGHIAYLFIIAGMIHLTLKLRIGWIMRLIGELMWVVLGFLMGYTSIWLWGSVFVLIDLYGFIKWKENNETS